MDINIEILKTNSYLIAKFDKIIAKFDKNEEEYIEIFDCRSQMIKDGKTKKYHNSSPDEKGYGLVERLKKRYFERYNQEKDNLDPIYPHRIPNISEEIKNSYIKPVIWILVGRTSKDEEYLIQVGTNKNIYCMFKNDFKDDIQQLSKSVKNNKVKGKNYSLLWNLDLDFECLEIYEVDSQKMVDLIIDKNNKEIDEEILNILKYKRKNNSFDYIYLDIRIKCIEGFLAQKFKCKNTNYPNDYKMWDPSPNGYDGFFYEYFSDQNTYFKNICKSLNLNF